MIDSIGNNAIGERLKKFRDDRNLSNIDIGNSLNTHNSTIGKIIKGKNNLTNEQLMALYAKYSLNLNWLLTGEGEMYVNEKSGSHKEPDIDLLTLMKKQSEDLKANFDRLFSQLSAPVAETEDQDLLFPNEDLTAGKRKKAGKL